MSYLSLILCFNLIILINTADAGPVYPGMGVVSHYLGTPNNYRLPQLLEKLNIQYLRDELRWQQVEKDKGIFLMNRSMRTFIDKLNALNIKPLIILDYNNKNYIHSKDDKTGPDGPENIKAFGDYVAFLVNSLKGKVYAWEIWNEPDHPSLWKPAPDSKNYGLLVKHVAPIIRRIDPHALIIAGSLANPGWRGKEFLNGLKKENALKDVDIISFHWYTYPNPPEKGHGPMTLDSVRDFIKAIHQEGKRVWITELGYPTSKDKYGVSEAIQANYLQKQLEMAAKMGVEVCFVYDLIDDGPDPSQKEHRHGLFRQDGTPKPAALMLTNISKKSSIQLSK